MGMRILEMWGWALAALGIFAARASTADIRLPQLWADNMVLQRDQPLTIAGSAEAGEPVRVRFRQESEATVAGTDGRWSVTLKPQAPGGPEEMRIEGHNTLTLKNVLVGDVWVASGQSNMEFSLKEADGAAAAIAASGDANIRLLRLQHDASAQPKADVRPTSWQVAGPGSVADFSAIAYLFARQLREHNPVPIGVIESAWGGTYAESWMSAEALQPFPEFAQRLRTLRGVTAKDEADYRAYVELKSRWNTAHRAEDRGSAEGRAPWADPKLNVSQWPLIEVPRPDSAWGTDFDGFDGTVWFRREIDIPPALAGVDVELHLGVPYHRAQAFYDGKPIDTVTADAGIYRVSGERVHAGRSVIAQRLTGGSGYIMLSGKPEDVFATAREQRIELAGRWSYQPGTDLADFPKPALLAAYYGLPGIAVLSNAMIEPLTQLPIKGVIWYQGESNVGAADQYRRLFPALVQDWRRRWHSGFPFLFVQIAGYGSDPAQPGAAPAAELREAQQAALTLPLTGMATAVDLGDAQNVHPKNKIEVARRLALLARQVAYGETVVASGPIFRELRVQGDRVRVQFDHVGSGLLAHDRYGYPRGFAIAGQDGRFVWAKALIEGSAVWVSNAEVKHPTAVRYGWANTPDGNVYNKAGLPMIPFRSDGPLRESSSP